ncbi:Nucleotide-diphospho-sugar transferase [Sesbania bispinosa]|nr:Nucleotide-diphospho-sugar transferase [Sesbania bispinosa]
MTPPSTPNAPLTPAHAPIPPPTNPADVAPPRCRDADYSRFSSYYQLPRFPTVFPSASNDSAEASNEYPLEKILNEAAMEDRTVILTTLNEAWAAPNSVIDLFLESFKIGDRTRRLLNHLVIIALDKKAFIRCQVIHTYCFLLVSEGIDFHEEAYFMTPHYLKMMWRRIDFLRSVLEMGYNFVFTDADIMWFRDPFPRFHHDADFQIACDHFTGNFDDVENRPNGGFNFVKSNNRSIEFYKFWYSSQETYPGYHDQDVLNFIKVDPFITDIGLKMKFLDTANFGGLCEPSRDLNQVCTMHANCCYGMDSKLHDLRIMLQDWRHYLTLPPSLKRLSVVSWRVPQKCRSHGSPEKSVQED